MTAKRAKLIKEAKALLKRTGPSPSKKMLTEAVRKMAIELKRLEKDPIYLRRAKPIPSPMRAIKKDDNEIVSLNWLTWGGAFFLLYMFFGQKRK